MAQKIWSIIPVSISIPTDVQISIKTVVIKYLDLMRAIYKCERIGINIIWVGNIELDELRMRYPTNAETYFIYKSTLPRNTMQIDFERPVETH